MKETNGESVNTLSLYRNTLADDMRVSVRFVLQLRYHDYLHKRHLVNPKKSGPFHFRAPSRIFYKAIRGMVPHKVSRDALHRVQGQKERRKLMGNYRFREN